MLGMAFSEAIATMLNDFFETDPTASEVPVKATSWLSFLNILKLRYCPPVPTEATAAILGQSIVRVFRFKMINRCEFPMFCSISPATAFEKISGTVGIAPFGDKSIIKKISMTIALPGPVKDPWTSRSKRPRTCTDFMIIRLLVRADGPLASGTELRNCPFELGLKTAPVVGTVVAPKVLSKKRRLRSVSPPRRIFELERVSAVFLFFRFPADIRLRFVPDDIATSYCCTYKWHKKWGTERGDGYR